MFLGKRAHQEYSGQLVGGRHEPWAVIRAWAVYLLVDKCSLTNREAINLTNSRLGDTLGTYTMDTGDLTESGEIHFARDKRQLLERIESYSTILTAGVSHRS